MNKTGQNLPVIVLAWIRQDGMPVEIVMLRLQLIEFVNVEQLLLAARAIPKPNTAVTFLVQQLVPDDRSKRCHVPAPPPITIMSRLESCALKLPSGSPWMKSISITAMYAPLTIHSSTCGLCEQRPEYSCRTVRIGESVVV